jgi:hypothetical protein
MIFIFRKAVKKMDSRAGILGAGTITCKKRGPFPAVV